MGNEAFRFDGKRVLVVGGASGMGEAASRIVQDLGGEVVVMDYAPVNTPGVTAIGMNLADKDSIDRALEECPGPVDVILSCAGVADGTPGIEKINFIGQRHLIERVVDEGRMPAGGAIGMISSAAGLGWEAQLGNGLIEYLETPDFATAVKWIEAHPDKATYGWSKQAVCAYTARQAFPFGKRGIRINAIQPGPTDTPLARANADVWLAFAADYRAELGIPASSAEQQAYPLIFLCSPAASHLSGTSILVDAGYVMSGLTGSFDAPFAKMMLGRA